MSEAAPALSLPLVAQVTHRPDAGDLENGLVNVINHMPLAVGIPEPAPGDRR